MAGHRIYGAVLPFCDSVERNRRSAADAGTVGEGETFMETVFCAGGGYVCLLAALSCDLLSGDKQRGYDHTDDGVLSDSQLYSGYVADVGRIYVHDESSSLDFDAVVFRIF